MSNNPQPFLKQLENIAVEDLQYIELDLSFTDLASLGFLLYAEERPNAEYVLQKLLVISQTATHNGSCDLLLKYATTINVHNWRGHLVEALAIIEQRYVLNKLGFDWQELRQHYLPHIAELSVHVHPVLKALYKMCEQLTPTQASLLVPEINERHKKEKEILRFYNYDHLEVFLLDWLTCRIINIGDRNCQNSDLNVLLEYFKLHELDEPKRLLVDTLKSNMEELSEDRLCESIRKDSTEDLSAKMAANVIIKDDDVEDKERYKVRREHAGIALIINQRTFYEETDLELKHLLPKHKLRTREGTDVDMKCLSTVFESFGYKPVEHTNITHLDMLHQIREVVKRSILFDSLVICILSHGIDGAVYGNNSIPLSINDIEHIITASSLQGKPKLLIIQACQKEESTKHQLVRKLINLPLIQAVEKTFSNKKVSTVSKDSLASVSYNNITPDAYADVVKAMSTVPGHVSMRNTETGTWFIQSLCTALLEYGNSKHILDILTTVTREVSEKRGNQNEVMLPITVNTLTKFFFLPSRS